ncbi:class I SAM-dependent methyltransferase [Bradyrhizobium sp. Arg62]|uniref:class I SAM-dependent methyltransferase n=1 Tax=Bradyrhizobium brasilense TaxID=1419277 RepID=UPI001E505ADC|nr:class I SAM-dependent methyltransferase [Bradyrhizobium brasilense]MCC8945709.1 class I SAM-dependent methyltransferase [Bradyrhizobium brasilense]
MRPVDSSLLRPAGQALNLEVFSQVDGHVLEGLLRTHEPSVWYPILQGVPCFLGGPMKPDLTDFCARHGLKEPVTAPTRPEASEQAKTNETFSDKWRRFKQYGLEPEHKEFLFGWYCKKLGLPDIDALQDFYRAKRRVLEVGPGSGFNTRFIAENCPGEVFALDVSDAAFTTFENTRDLHNCCVVQADLMEAPFPDDTFDFIIADGVLHHTPNTQLAVEALYKKVRPGGQFFFYVYRKMGAVRVFTDGYLRENFMPLSAEECYAACEGITELGRELSRLNATIELKKPIPALGIPAGKHNVQRLLYYNFLKCFWNEAFDYETNNMVNFDWYHPHNAWQHTEEEVEGWLKGLGVESYSFNDSNPNGISVLATKPLA